MSQIKKIWWLFTGGSSSIEETNLLDESGNTLQDENNENLNEE